MPPFVPPSKWRKLAKGVWKTDLGKELPEILVLRMTDAEFRKFRSSVRFAQTYIDKRKYLKRKLIKFVFTSVVGERGSRNAWSLILVHTTLSTGRVIAWQDPCS
ncbi:MAG TPA: hypothetical protein VMF66_20670 [Candidatus Acidoferrum sp.]|nr:hypothetical protein [Candidatus Acidoferrum sp.]